MEFWEEVERHLNLCNHYRRTPNWVGRIPYVFARFVLAGKQPSSFQGWIDQFMGGHRPVDDLADYFRDLTDIELVEVPSFENIDSGVAGPRFDVIGNEVQENRRNGEEGLNINAYRLAEHDSRFRKLSGGNSATASAAWRLCFGIFELVPYLG